MSRISGILLLSVVILLLDGCGSTKKIKYIFPNDYEGYHVFVESDDADELAADGSLTTIVVPEGRVSFIRSFAIFREWHEMEAERRNGSRILVDNSDLDPEVIRLYSVGDSGVLLNGEKREGAYIFLGDPKSYESFRSFWARNTIDPNIHPDLPAK